MRTRLVEQQSVSLRIWWSQQRYQAPWVTVWTPWIRPENDGVKPHGHRWSFASWIITGTLRETMFDVVRYGRDW